jgi:signal transduction histidine kinase
MVAWRSGQVGGRTTDWFHWSYKFRWFFMMLRDRWAEFDIDCVALLSLVILIAAFHRRIGFSRMLAMFAVFLTIVFLLLPRIVFGSAYADMRLAPYAFAMALLAIRFQPSFRARTLRWIAIASLAFFLVRIGATTASFRLYDRVYDRELAALDHVPRGARLVSFTGIACRQPWKMSRLEHLPAMATVRREAFSNDQWTMVGAQLLTVHYPAGGRFVQDPSQMVTERRCRGETWLTLDESLRQLPRDAFDYVWLIQPPRHDPALLAGLQPIWRSGTSVLYRIADRWPPPAALGELK